MKASVKRLVDILDDVGMFFLTWACVIVSSYVPAFQAGQHFEIDLNVWRLIVALIPATIVTAVIELKGIVNADSLEAAAKAKEGRRKNAWLRILLSIVLGLAWPTIMGKVMTLLGLGS